MGWERNMCNDLNNYMETRPIMPSDVYLQSYLVLQLINELHSVATYVLDFAPKNKLAKVVLLVDGLEWELSW